MRIQLPHHPQARHRLQVSVKRVVVSSGAVTAVPFNACEPVHPPDALQRVASVELHDSVVVLPESTAGGVATSVTVGAELTMTALGLSSGRKG